MTDHEYEIIDELYFVISFEELQQRLGLDETELKQWLNSLLDLGYIKCFSNVS